VDKNTQSEIEKRKAIIIRYKKAKTEEEKITKYNAFYDLLNLYQKLKMWKESKENGEEAFKIAKKLKDKIDRLEKMAVTSEKIGDLSTQIQEYSDSKKYYNDTLKLFQQTQSEFLKIDSPETKNEVYRLQFSYFVTFAKLVEITKKLEDDRSALKALEKKYNELLKKDRDLQAIQGLAHVSLDIAKYYMDLDEGDLFWNYLSFAYTSNKIIRQLFPNKNTSYWEEKIKEIENLFENEILKIMELKEKKNEIGIEILEALSHSKLSNKDHFHLKNIITAKGDNLIKKSPKKFIKICKDAELDTCEEVAAYANSEKILALIEENQYNEAIELSQDTLKKINKIKNDKFKTFFNGKVNLNLARVYYRKHDSTAEKFAKKALSFFQKDIISDNHECITFIELGYFLIQQNKFSIGLKSFLEVIAVKGGGNPEILARTYEGLSQTDYNLLNYEYSFLNAGKAALFYNILPKKSDRYQLNLSNAMNIFLEYLKSQNFEF